MLLSLSSHSNFDKILEKHVSGQDLLTVKNVSLHLNKEVNCCVWTIIFFTIILLSCFTAFYGCLIL